jgi:small glutamine-rich tetratricopeptide repeat-containing protein alpha
VASQCLESAFEIAVDDEICKNNFDSGINLLEIAEKNVIKRELAPELKERADKHKTEGNELMKQEKFNEALEQYNKAIDIDKNNAVYYCNRAAAHSKLSDFTSSIEDCKIALKIDPSYGKAWGRLGLALLSNNQFEEAYEAYNKAIQLEPSNDGYKQNLKIVEEKLKNMSFNPSGLPVKNKINLNNATINN